MSRLIDSFPSWYDSTTGAIFHAMASEPHATEDFPWLENASILDTEYIGNHSGDKIVSPLLDRFITQNHDEDDPRILTGGQRSALARILMNKYRNKWTRLYAVESAEYNPINNYDMSESETPNITHKHSVSNDYAETTTHTTERDVSRAETPSNDYRVTDTRTTDRDVTRTETASADYEVTDTKAAKTNMSVATVSDTNGEVYGFNSASPVPSTGASGNSTVTTTGNANDNVITDTHAQTGGMTVHETADANDNVETNEHTQTGGITVRETASANNNVEETTNTQTGYTQDTETGTRTLTRSGNIGVTTSQQMLESEIALWQWNFIESVFADIDSLLTINVY